MMRQSNDYIGENSRLCPACNKGFPSTLAFERNKWEKKQRKYCNNSLIINQQLRNVSSLSLSLSGVLLKMEREEKSSQDIVQKTC